MKRSTFMGCFVGLLALTMQAQIVQPSISTTQQGTTKIEDQKKAGTSIEDLLVRYNNVGNQSGSISDHFTMEEQQMLRSYFSNKLPITNEVPKKAQYTPSFVTTDYTDSFGNSTGIDYSTENRVVSIPQTPLFLAPEVLTAEDEAEILADAQYRENSNIENNAGVTNNRNPLADIIPTAGATETFNPAVGDNFFDPGGPGGSTTGGSPGNYPNCGCDTKTTLAGVSEIDFLYFSVFANFDYLRIYDGTDATGTLLYDNGAGGPNEGDRELADMIASHGSSTFTASSGNIFFMFHSSTVVDYGGWDVEIVSTGGGGGGGTPSVVYGLNLRAGACSTDFGTFPLAGPYNIAPISNTITPIYGGDFDGSGTLYAFDGTAATLLTIDTTTGAETTVAPITGLLAAETLRGIAWNEANSTMYLMAGAGDVGSIYTVNLTTAVATLVGSTTIAGWIPIWLAIDSTGNAFMADVGLDSLYSVSLTTGTATLVGALGININFAQDADFDPQTDILYMGAYLGGGVNVFASVNTTTGVATSLGSVNTDCAEMGIVALKGTSGGGGGGALTTVYGINNGNQDLIGFGVATPGTTEVFGTSPVTVNFENAGAIDPANPTTGYALDNAGQFYSFDVTSGFYTLLGNIPGDWIGMEFDRVSGTLYAIAGADLYTIDPVAVTATLVGATGINPSDLPIALAIDGAGVGYTYEIVTDNLYSIDLATATATLIGNIGFDANFGQGMCYDPTTDMVYMSAFNSTAFASEWRSVNTTTGATTLIGEIVTPATTTQVAWSSIGETLPPPVCPEPTDLVVSNITETTADLSWSAEPNASNGYVWYVFLEGANPAVDPAVSTGTTVAGTTTATAGGLTNGIAYDFYVVADCDVDGLSSYAGPVTFETLITPPACGGKFYDTGGAAGDYENNANVTTTITPTNAGELVTVTFTSFEVETGWDALYVYDGPDASAPIISSGNPATNSGFPAGGYYGTTNPGPFTSSHATGALTFVFLSDASVPQAGWEADVTCALSAPPNDLIVNSIDVDEIGFPYTDPAVHMPAATTEGGNPLNCDLTGANGVWYNFVSGGDGQANAMIVTPSGASSVTFYTAPDENATETDLVLVPQNTNQCVPGTSASIYTLAGQAYYVFVLNTGAITDIVIDGTNLSVSENTIAGFSFYPNPTNGILNLKSVDNIDHVSLYNLLGQLVVDNRVDATASQIDISGLSTGTYLMKVTVNGQTGTYKVLKD